MSFSPINDPDAEERQEQHRTQPRVADPISQALGATVYVAKHRITLHLTTPVGRTPRLWVSRYYWGLAPPVAVDFVKAVPYGKPEVDAKRVYFKARGIQYLLLANEWDAEAITGTPPATSAPAQPDGSPAATQPAAPAQRPVVAPRRNSTKRR